MNAYISVLPLHISYAPTNAYTFLNFAYFSSANDVVYTKLFLTAYWYPSLNIPTCFMGRRLDVLRASERVIALDRPALPYSGVNKDGVAFLFNFDTLSNKHTQMFVQILTWSCGINHNVWLGCRSIRSWWWWKEYAPDALESTVEQWSHW